MKPLSRFVVVFDVESVGLHGEGFAVGAVLWDREKNQEVSTFYAACPPDMAKGVAEDREWIEQNVVPHLSSPTHVFPREVREAFWAWWLEAAQKGATLWADCGWPVEARFLAACVDDDHEARKWQGPYPLGEIAMWVGMDTHSRLPDELPIHHPLSDSRQSLRLLLEAESAFRELNPAFGGGG